MKKINTVTGAINPEKLGFTLPHEHLMVDFIGAAEVSPDRYEKDDVVSTMLPYLLEIKKLGVQSFVDCTPPYLGRDPKILKALSEKSGINILTCTGIYNKQYIPDWAEKGSIKEITDFIIKEARFGCDETGILPAFIKTAVMPDKLTTTEEKLITAAARASHETGLPIGTHTGKAAPANEILTILKREELDPSRWIYIHAQNEDDNTKLLKIAESGCYIELDGLAWGGDENHLTKLLALKDAGFIDKVLMSQDAGWYRVGEPAGGEKKGFSRIITEFMPYAREKGISHEDFDRIFRINPARAFAV